jgi:hypothetical protein
LARDRKAAKGRKEWQTARCTALGLVAPHSASASRERHGVNRTSQITVDDTIFSFVN